MSKLDAGEYDAIILATSGLKRVELSERIKQEIDIDISLPAVGQGALAIECRADDEAVLALLKPLNDGQARIRLKAERALNRRLEGGCQVPIAAYAVIEKDAEQSHQKTLWLRGRVGSEDGTVLLKSDKRIELTGDQATREAQAEQLGIEVADELLSLGADSILAAIYADKKD